MGPCRYVAAVEAIHDTPEGYLVQQRTVPVQVESTWWKSEIKLRVHQSYLYCHDLSSFSVTQIVILALDIA